MIRRHGSTLVELVLSMSAGSAVMLLAISLVHQSMTLNESSRHRSDQNRVLDQLALRFRGDVHSAMDIDVDAESAMSIKSLDGSVVTYVAKNRSIVRERKNAVGGNEQERYVLADSCETIFQKLSNPMRASLVVSYQTGLKGIPPRIDLSIRTTVGRWQNLENMEGEVK